MPKISKKNKSSWRKNIDISDVERYLEVQREEERIGDVTEKLDAELFSKEVEPAAVRPNIKTIRKQKFVANAIFCAVQENTSKVQDPIVKRNIVTNNEKLLARKHKDENKKQRKYSLPNRSCEQSKKGDRFNKDIWQEEDVIPRELKNEWIGGNVVLHHMKHTGQPLVKVAPSTHEKPNAVPNVEIPSRGASYNPSIDDYNELKHSIIKKEENHIRRRMHLDRVVTNKFTKMPKQEQNELILKEMSEGLFCDEENVCTATEKSDDEYAAINLPVENKKKDRKAKNKRIRLNAKRSAELYLAKELNKLKDIDRLPELNAELTKSLKKTEKKRVNRIKRMEEKKNHPGRVAYLQFEEADDHFIEPVELASGLRNMVTNRSLAADRFKSFQKRILIAPKKHRDGISRSNKSTLKKWKRFTLNTHKEM